MNRKLDKVEEPTVPYATKKVSAPSAASKPSDTGVKYADLRGVREQNAKLMQVHHKVLKKLAQ